MNKQFLMAMVFILAAGCSGGDEHPAQREEAALLPPVDLPDVRGPLSPPEAVSVFVGRESVAVDGEPSSPVPLDRGSFLADDLRDGIEGLYVIPLGRLLEKRRKDGGNDGTLSIFADRTTPYRALTQVLYTSGMSEFDRFFLITEDGKAKTALRILPPRTSPTDDDSKTNDSAATLELMVMITDAGFKLGTGAGSDGPLIPKRDDDWDFQALARELELLVGDSPRETLLVLGMEDDLPVEVLARAMIAAHASFPHVMLTRGTI